MIRDTARRRLSIPVLVAALFVWAAGTAAAEGLFNPKTFTLDNGMQVVLIEDHRAPVVTQMVWYKIGSADEPRGKSGIAHFLEHLMFKGTSEVPPGEFSAIVTRNGGRENAFTSYDYTGYYQTVAADRLETMMRLEADRMVNLTFTEEQVASERLVILEERRSRVENSPSGLFFEQMNATQYLAYPYRIPVIGWASEIAGLTRGDALDWYETYYAPNNAILIVAGDVTLEALRPLAEKYYGAIPRRDVPPRTRVDEPPQRAARRIEMRHPQVTEPSWRRGYLAPSFFWGESEHALALQMLAEILGGGTTSRLYRDLVVQREMAVQASAFYSASDVGPARFFLFGVPRGDYTLADIEGRMDEIVADLLENGVTEEEVERTRRSLLASVVYARDSVQTAARIFGEGLAIGRTIEDIESWPERLKRVTVEDVNAAAVLVFNPERSVTGLLRPEEPS